MSEVPLSADGVIPLRADSSLTYRATSLMKNCVPPQDHRRALNRPTVGSWGVAFFYERDILVLKAKNWTI